MSDRGGFGPPGHLVRRFAGSLWPGGPGVAGEAWARNWLAAPEVALWARMHGADRRHAVAVARRAATALGSADGSGLSRAVLAAALLHDVGKVESQTGVFARAAATIVALVAGRGRVAGWATCPGGWRRRAGLYVSHDRVGADMLSAAGSDPLVVVWAAEHHLPAKCRSVEPRVAGVLAAADDD
ncbi:MAG: HDIG domain-containing metalloprotein [Acidimicrobiales bacterium]